MSGIVAGKKASSIVPLAAMQLHGVSIQISTPHEQLILLEDAPDSQRLLSLKSLCVIFSMHVIEASAKFVYNDVPKMRPPVITLFQ